MTRNLLAFAAAALLAGVAACGPSTPAEKSAAAPAAAPGPAVSQAEGMPTLDAERDSAARLVYSQFAAGDMAALKPRFGPEFSTPEAAAALPIIQAGVPSQAPTSVKLTNWKSDFSAFKGPRTEKLGTFHLYSYPEYTVQVETVLSREYGATGGPGPWQINGFHIERKPIDHPAG